MRQLARRRAAPGAVILGYHDVTAPDTPSEGYSVSASDLSAHLAVLGRLGFTVVPLGRIAERLRAADEVDLLAAVTFDDALVGVHRHGLPVLADRGAVATVFTVTGAWGEPPPWWPGMPRTMTEPEIAEVAAAGHEIGSHTCSHRSLPTLDPDELVSELVESRRALRDISGQPVDALAYPSGHHDPAVRRAAQAAGYRTAVTFLNGRVVGSEDPMRLPRLTMGAHLSPRRLAYHLLRGPATWPDHQLDRVDGSAGQQVSAE
jgi:peptidoglycan/xylan/chitin deacetylase (PgdA/CDA1 family)